jgi:ABC-type uncharacterized transport system substrate-binding protein
LPPIHVRIGDEPFGTANHASAMTFLHPGGNITGVTILAEELFGKRLELLHEIAPNASKIAYL